MNSSRKSNLLFAFQESDQEEQNQNQSNIQSQIKIKRKQVNRLSFKESESGGSSDEKQRNGLVSTTTGVFPSSLTSRNQTMNLRRTKRASVIQSKKLKPSIMCGDLNQDQEYDVLDIFAKKSGKVNQQKQSYKPQKLSFFNNFTNQKQNTNQKKEIIIEDQQLQVKDKRKRKARTKKVQESKPQIKFIAQFFFEQPQIQETQQQKKMVIEESLENEKTENQIQVGQQMMSTNKKLIHNLLFPSSLMKSYSDKINQAIHLQTSMVNGFLFNPISPKSRMIFDVLVYNNFLDKAYEFWVDLGQNMKILMKCTKSLGWSRTEYIITSELQKEKCMVGKIVSNLERDQFIIYDKQPDIASTRVQIIGTIVIGCTITGENHLSLYYPGLDKKGKSKPIYKNSISNSLKQLYKSRLVDSDIECLYTKAIDKEKISQINKQYELKKSQKTMFFERENEGNVHMFIGKKQSKRYKVICGEGLTPLQVFCITIARIQH